MERRDIYKDKQTNKFVLWKIQKSLVERQWYTLDTLDKNHCAGHEGVFAAKPALPYDAFWVGFMHPIQTCLSATENQSWGIRAHFYHSDSITLCTKSLLWTALHNYPHCLCPMWRTSYHRSLTWRYLLCLYSLRCGGGIPGPLPQLWMLYHWSLSNESLFTKPTWMCHTLPRLCFHPSPPTPAGASCLQTWSAGGSGHFQARTPYHGHQTHSCIHPKSL